MVDKTIKTQPADKQALTENSFELNRYIKATFVTISNDQHSQNGTDYAILNVMKQAVRWIFI